jgi:hypothetical protein
MSGTAMTVLAAAVKAAVDRAGAAGARSATGRWR